MQTRHFFLSGPGLLAGVVEILAVLKLSALLPVDDVPEKSPRHCLYGSVEVSTAQNADELLEMFENRSEGEFHSKLTIQRLQIIRCGHPSIKATPTSPYARSSHGRPCERAVCRLLPAGQSYTLSCSCEEEGGTNCVKELDECQLNQPCKNGATCQGRLPSYKCHCPPGYYGQHCETDLKECASTPCSHGDCVDIVNGYRCDCHPGYTGNLCETDVDECTSDPCINGDCKEGINNFTCTCQPGYTGARCGEDIDDCASSPCLFLGVCRDLVNDYTCQCLHGYKGKNCETEWLTETMFIGFVNKINGDLMAAEKNRGPVYTRWGRSSCPPSAELLYSGFTAGPPFNASGGGTNLLCFPPEPIYGRYSNNPGSRVHNIEYQFSGSTPDGPYDSNLNEHDVPCAVCMATGKSLLLMLPARNMCPSGWVREYYGYLVTEKLQSYRIEYVCVDDAIEVVPNTQGNDFGTKFTTTGFSCAGLHCPPYVKSRELTCSVCTQ